MHKLHTLQNGLKILLVPYTGTQAAAVFVSAKTGSKNETKEINGISHFLEHMVFKGTEKMKDQTELSEAIDKLGGGFNGFTSEENTSYYAKVANQHLELAIDWVSQLYLKPIIPAHDVKKEKSIIIEEINMYKDNPMSFVANLWQGLLYPDQPAGWPIAGTKKSVNNIKHKDLVNYWKNNYVANNTLVCLAGNFDSKKALSLLKKYFGKINDGKSNIKPRLIEKQKSPALKIHFKETDQTHLLLGVKTFNVHDKRKYPLALLSETLGGMMSSRLFIEIREKRGLAYYVGTSTEENIDSGFLVTRAGVENKNSYEAVKAILEEYKKVRKEGITAEELKKAKDYIKGQTVLGLESCEALAGFYSGQELAGEKIKTPKEIFKEIDKIEKSDIVKVAKDVFRPERLNLAMVGPISDQNKFKQLLKEF
ncbi:MAG: pitrilysin family protein [Candidatus Paceibacterota bacterium]|jgi:predicted Zn-dependent peptidase